MNVQTGMFALTVDDIFGLQGGDKQT